MEQYTIKKPDSMKRRKRVGIGPSSGHGKTSCRGHNGQKSRSGSSSKPWFEGGQMPLQRRIPKRGFNNIFRKEYQLVNVSQLEKLNTAEVTPALLKKAGLIDKADKPVKILGKGDIKISVKVTADAFSNGAMDKIKAAGGEVNLRTKE